MHSHCFPAVLETWTKMSKHSRSCSPGKSVSLQWSSWIGHAEVIGGVDEISYRSPAQTRIYFTGRFFFLQNHARRPGRRRRNPAVLQNIPLNALGERATRHPPQSGLVEEGARRSQQEVCRRIAQGSDHSGHCAARREK